MSLEYTFWWLHWYPSVIRVSHGGSTRTIALIQLFVVAQQERDDLLAFRLCCLTLCTEVEFDLSAPDHCLLIYNSVTLVSHLNSVSLGGCAGILVSMG